MDKAIVKGRGFLKSLFLSRKEQKAQKRFLILLRLLFLTAALREILRHLTFNIHRLMKM